MNEGPPNRVLPKVTTTTVRNVASAAAGAASGKPTGGPPGPGAAVSRVSEAAAEVIGAYARTSGEATPAPTPEPAPAKPIEESAASPLKDGAEFTLGDLEAFVSLTKRAAVQEGCATEEFDAGKFLRERAPQKRLTSHGLAARAIGHLANGRAHK